jgi:hypothetical protein
MVKLIVKSCAPVNPPTYTAQLLVKFFLKSYARTLATYIGKIFLKICAPEFLASDKGKILEKLCTRVPGNIHWWNILEKLSTRVPGNIHW